MKLRLASAALHLTHLAVIGFSTLGWLWAPARPYHLALAALIAASWFVLGPLVGQPGLCAVTAVQHRIWERLAVERPQSYVVFLVELVTRRPANPVTVDRMTQAVFYATTVASIVLFATEH
ncbi:hypothetical protein [Engelhardtia mirabilis]|uniref:DUF2784 domain-containing protein n=1 Tax=Engelhardtia mirabilis TaxID=2528011 RepID=A0A518BRJ5_9BACT|nr:hypothetical protein Pla133_47170 [Planctomycetes bacterium Pla133]QDV03923.1 hypothetical protein Pla86_47150 [Planctomycetes bacterium Pla86]